MSSTASLQSRRREAIDALSYRRRLFHLALLSAAGLLLELVLIRWLDAHVRLLVYVKNLPLIASFLGLGLGYATHRRSSLVPQTVLLGCLALGIGLFLGSSSATALRTGPASIESNLGVDFTAQNSGQVVAFFFIVSALFLVLVVAMVPVGQIAAEHMDGLPTLPSYSANIVGSLVGVAVSFVLAALSSPPWLSAGLALLILLPHLRSPNLYRWSSLLAIILTCGAMYAFDHRPNQVTSWSPYNKIEVELVPYYFDPDGRVRGTTALLRVQNLFYQKILDLSDAAARRWGSDPLFRLWRYRYDYPFLWKPRPRDVLILGAGTGNDVAAALRNGAQHVDAVEIDPEILRIGRVLHPERPYDDPRVQLIPDDARAVLRRPGKNYDVIVFGLLDSHNSFYSSLGGNIRLDNYVYTIESFRQAIARLAPNGVLALSFYVQYQWLVTRMERMLETALGHRPFVLMNSEDIIAVTFIADASATLPQRPEVQLGVPPELIAANPPGPSAEDDWPFLYLRSRSVPQTILAFSVGTLIATALLVWIFFRFHGAVGFDGHFFFLGAGFLLLETRTIAQLALLLGTTWRVSALTIGGILALILVANLIIAHTGALPRRPLYAMLFIALLLNYLVPVGVALGGGALATVLMAALLGWPLLCAALIFASSITKPTDLTNVLASNLVGSVMGGILENLSLVIGISMLSLVAAIVYAMSYRRTA